MYRFIDHRIEFYLECAALVKQGKVYGVGTEDMDVRNYFSFDLILYSFIIYLGINIWC